MNKGVIKKVSTCRRVPNKNKHPREHWTRKKGQWKPKKIFKSIEEGESYIKHYKLVGYRAYVCPVCGNVHIGLKIEKDGK